MFVASNSSLHNETEEDLRAWDRQTFKERLARWVLLRQLADPPAQGWSVPGTVISGSLWWEAGRCYIGGNYIAAVILAQSSMEQCLAEILRRRGIPDVDRLGFKALIEAAEKIRELSSSLAIRLHELRRLRNPYVHADLKDWPPQHLKRAWSKTEGDMYALSEKDARFAIEVGADFIKYMVLQWDPYAERPDTPKLP